MNRVIASAIVALSLLPTFAIMPEVPRQSVWPEGKMPNAQEHQQKPWYRWLEPTNRTCDVIYIITNGGGYHGGEPGGNENCELEKYLLAKGVTVVEFKYRTPRPKNLEKHVTAWQDAQRVIRIARHEAKRRGMDPERIGFCGFSAGGHLTILTAVSSQTPAYESIGDEIDKEPCHVNFAVPVYPAYGLEAGADSPEDTKTMSLDMPLVPEFKFDGKTAPMCFLHGGGDDWTPMTSVRCWHRERAMRLPTELHVMALEGHCFQYRATPGTPAYHWCDRVWQWLVKLDLVTRHPCNWSGPTCPVNSRAWTYITPGRLEAFADFEPKSWLVDGMCGAWIPAKDGSDFTIRKPAVGDYALDFEFQLYNGGTGVVALGDVELVLQSSRYPQVAVNRCTVYKKDGRPYGFVNSEPIPAECFRPLGDKSVGDKLVFRGLRTKENGYCKYHKARFCEAAKDSAR